MRRRHIYTYIYTRISRALRARKALGSLAKLQLNVTVKSNAEEMHMRTQTNMITFETQHVRKCEQEMQTNMHKNVLEKPNVRSTKPRYIYIYIYISDTYVFDMFVV